MGRRATSQLVRSATVAHHGRTWVTMVSGSNTQLRLPTLSRSTFTISKPRQRNCRTQPQASNVATRVPVGQVSLAVIVTELGRPTYPRSDQAQQEKDLRTIYPGELVIQQPTALSIATLTMALVTNRHQATSTLTCRWGQRTPNRLQEPIARNTWAAQTPLEPRREEWLKTTAWSTPSLTI